MYNENTSSSRNVSVEFSESELKMIRDYSTSNNIDVSEIIRKATLDMIEEDLDIKALEAAMERVHDGSRFYSLDEVGEELEFQ